MLLLELQLATGLLSAQPSLALPPLFLGVALCGGLFSYHFVAPFRTLACALTLTLTLTLTIK